MCVSVSIRSWCVRSMQANIRSRGRTCKESWNGWLPEWRRRELRSRNSANTSSRYVKAPLSRTWRLRNFSAPGACLKRRLMIVLSRMSDVFCLLLFYRSINWPTAPSSSHALMNPRSWVGSGHPFLLLLRLSRRERKVQPLTKICRFSERARSSAKA